MTDLTILCVSEGREHASRFVSVMSRDAESIGAKFKLVLDGKDVHSAGYVESVLDQALAECDTEYVLRLDDDERMSEDMVSWLSSGDYRACDHWAFRRRNLWPDAEHYISNKPLYPDFQTRLSVKSKSGQRPAVHQGSPYGTGVIGPGCLEHFKFLVRSREDREALVQRYDNASPGAGAQYVMFSVPELYGDQLQCEPVES